MTFYIEPKHYDRPQLEKQVGAVLELLSEERSRKHHPRFWEVFDRLTGIKKGTRDQVRSSSRYKLGGAALFIVGMIMLVPELISGAEEINLYLILGTILSGGGIIMIRPSKRHRASSRFKQSARRYIKRLQANDDVQMLIDEAGIAINDEPLVPLSTIELLLETEDSFVMAFEKSMVLIMKADLDLEQAEYRSFMETETDKKWIQVI